MIQVEGLTKDYGSLRAVNAIDFNVKEEAFFALLGPNGAGKSTTIEMLSTLKTPTSGSVTINGYTLGKDDDAIRKSIGVVFQYSTLDPNLTVRENLRFRGRFYYQDKTALDARIEALKDETGFASYIDTPFKKLSGGQKRRVDVARALLHEPKLLLLDEPTTGLDPQAREALWDLILKIKAQSKMTILLTTHYMQEVIDCDHVIILNEGDIIAEDSAEALRIAYAHDTLKIVPGKPGFAETLKKDTVTFSSVQNTIHIPIEDPFKALSIVHKYKDAIKTFEIVKGDMDDVFLSLTGRHLGGGME
ncbi:MAG: ABC transporter ATP-binding protein [Bacillota bacterium]